MQPYLIGVDVGTQSVKAVIFRETGERVASATEPLSLLRPDSGTVEQDPDEIYGSVLRTVRQALEQARIDSHAVAAIGIDAQMAGIIGVDDALRPTTAYDSWLDSRCSACADEMRKRAGDAIIGSTGGQSGLTHGPKILWRMREYPSVYRNTARFLTLTSYLVARCCGLSANETFIDDTHLHFTEFADSVGRKWNPDLLDLFGVDPQKLPGIRRSCECAGGLTPETATGMGLLPGTPMAVGCGDTAASVFGAGIAEEGFCYDIAGTASVFAGCTMRFAPDVQSKTLNYMRSPIDGLWTPLAYINGGGLCLRWFRDVSGKSYAELDRLAEQAERGSHGLIFVPHFTGRSFPNDPAVSGAFIGLDWSHTVGELYRAVMESIAYEYRIYLNVFRRANPEIKPKTVIGVGGGAQSAVFNRIKADVLGLPYCRLAFGDTAPWGSAVLAGYACGLYTDLKTTVLRNRRDGGTEMPQHTNAYQTSVRQYETILNNFSKLRKGVSENL